MGLTVKTKNWLLIRDVLSLAAAALLSPIYCMRKKFEREAALRKQPPMTREKFEDLTRRST